MLWVGGGGGGRKVDVPVNCSIPPTRHGDEGDSLRFGQLLLHGVSLGVIVTGAKNIIGWDVMVLFLIFERETQRRNKHIEFQMRPRVRVDQVSFLSRIHTQEHSLLGGC